MSHRQNGSNGARHRLPRYQKRKKQSPQFQAMKPPKLKFSSKSQTESPRSSISSMSSQSSVSSHSSLREQSSSANKAPKMYQTHSANMPTLPHLIRNNIKPSPKLQPKTPSNSNLLLTIPKNTKRSHSHDATINNQQKTTKQNIKSKAQNPLFHRVQTDVNLYIQRFLYYASKSYFYCNEYSASRDEIACVPLTQSELTNIHKQAYKDTILNDEVRQSPISIKHMIDAQIGANYDKIYNGIYGIYQCFVDKNNHISFIYNDKIIFDKMAEIDLLNVVSNDDMNWNKFKNEIVQNMESELLGTYKSYSLQKFEKMIQREYNLMKSMLSLIKNQTKNVQNGYKKDGNDDDNKNEAIEHELKCNLNKDKLKIMKKNQSIKTDNKQNVKSKDVRLEIDEYVKSMNAMMNVRKKSFVSMKKGAKNDKKWFEIELMLKENEKLVIVGKKMYEFKFECAVFDENMIKYKKEFIGKCKRFKREIKDKIDCLKQVDFMATNSQTKVKEFASLITSIMRFCRHNLKNGTMSFLKTMLSNITQMRVPKNEQIKNNDGKILHKSVLIQLSKQLDVCNKSLSKLHEYALKKEEKMGIKMKQIGMNQTTEANGQNEDENGEDADEYHSDDIVFRINESGHYEKKFLIVVWKKKIYQIYENECSFVDGKQPLIERNFKASDYGYNGHMTVNLRRSAKSKKVSVVKGYQFIINEHAFVVESMLDIKYWRNYIQKGQNLRKVAEDWENENRHNNTSRDRWKRPQRRSRSSSLV